MKSILILSLLFASFTFAAMPGNNSLPIVGGVDVAANDPIAHSTVALYLDGGLCSATIIAKKALLTAGHCDVSSGNYDDAYAAFDLNLWNKSGKRIGIQEIIVNPNFQDNRRKEDDRQDLSVVILKEEIPAGYVPVTISDAMPSIGDTIILAGYGLTQAGDYDGDQKDIIGRLKKTTTTVLQFSPRNTEIAFDTSHGSSDCSGDSGGPAFVQTAKGLQLLGADSRGPATCDKYSIYTRVAAFNDWIRQQLVRQ